jgi:hypothetical protein
VHAAVEEFLIQEERTEHHEGIIVGSCVLGIPEVDPRFNVSRNEPGGTVGN